MKFLIVPSRQLTRSSVQRWSWLAPQHARCMSFVGSNPPNPVSQVERTKFEDLGLDESFVRSLHKAFPNLKHPTDMQARLIPEILGKQDVLLKDVTGSGKSLGMVLGLLNKPRLVSHESDDNGGMIKKEHITSLLVVPHRDLAYQFYHWVERLMTALEDPPELSSVVQLLVRGECKTPVELIPELKANPPHILLCTPQALMEVYEADADALNLEKLSTIAVDEVDYLVETAARKDPDKSYWKAYEKARQKLIRHPGPTREFLDVVYAKRKERDELQGEEEEEDKPNELGWYTVKGRQDSKRREEAEEEGEKRLPQLILSSATLRAHLKNYLFEESGWLNKGELVKIFATKPRTKRVGITEEDILHSVLVVSGNEVKNIEGAVEVEQEVVEWNEDLWEEEVEVEANAKYEKTGSPFDPTALEAIATAFAVDVRSVALLVIPSSSPVQRAVYELRSLGVNAQRLDMRGGQEIGGSATLLVGTVATTRGLDLPQLTHVFVLGVAEGRAVNGRTVDGYVHIAGRVGRFGRRGSVISVVDAGSAGKMGRVLSTLSIQPVVFNTYT